MDSDEINLKSVCGHCHASQSVLDSAEYDDLEGMPLYEARQREYLSREANSA